MERGAITIEQLCREYLDQAEQGVVLTRRGEAKSESALSTDRGRIDRHIIPLIGLMRRFGLSPDIQQSAAALGERWSEPKRRR